MVMARWDLFFLLRGLQTENHGGGTDSNDVGIAEEGLFFLSQEAIHIYCARGRAGIAKEKLPFVALLAGCDDAVRIVHTGINGFDGRIGFGALHEAANDILALHQGDDLLEVESVFNDNQRTGCGKGCFFLFSLNGALGYSDFKLLMAIAAFKDQRAAWLVLCLVKGDGVVAFGTSDAFHGR